MAHNARTTPSPVHISTQFYAQFSTASSTSTFYFVGAFPSNIPRQFNDAASTLMSYLLYFAQFQFISSFNQGIAFVIPVLTTFLQLKYQGNNDQNNTPFAKNPTTMLVAVSSSIVYSLAYFVLLRFSLRRFAVVAYHCLVWSGYASVASLASLLFKDSVSPVIYAIFVLISATELLRYLYLTLVVVEEGEDRDFQAYRRRIYRFLNNACNVVSNSSGRRPQLLPI